MKAEEGRSEVAAASEMSDGLGKGFEPWLRTVCFQQPTPEAYDLAKDAWVEAKKQERERCIQAVEGIEKDRDWVPGSLYDKLRRESATAIRKA